MTDSSPKIELARATAVAVLSANYEISAPGKINLAVDTLSDVLCSEEKFSQDISLAYACTGFLVAPDLLVTAGHCGVNVGETRNQTADYCEAFSWLFDFRANDDGKVETKNISSENHYKCKQIIYAVREEGPAYRDFALVQLDRPVKNRTPLKLATTEPKVKDSLFMIGHPLGSPTKLSADAEVLLNDKNRQSLISNLDAFDGNSGSPVFNEKNEVLGILVGGTPGSSLIDDPKGRKCRIYNRCDNEGNNCLQPDKDTSVFPGFQRTGSEVQKIGPLIELIEKFQKGQNLL